MVKGAIDMNEVLSLLLANLDEAYEKKAWHGANLRGSLRGISAEEAVRRPAKGRHNIWELASHAAYWKYAVRRKLRGDKRGSFPMKGSNWFESPSRAQETEWKDLVRLLHSEHGQLRETVAALTDSELRQQRVLRLVYGIAAHDLYHTGQIQIVKRLVRSA